MPSLEAYLDQQLALGHSSFSSEARLAFEAVWKELIVRLKGDQWKLTGQVIAELRKARFQRLLM